MTEEVGVGSFLERYDRPVFVTGTARSGTTLLCRMLSAHSQVYVKNEMAEPCRALREGNLAGFVAELGDAVRAKRGSDLAQLLHDSGRTRWGLKDPRLTHCLDCLLRHLPKARILITLRDGRAVARSYMKMGWGAAANVYAAAERWSEEVRRQETFLEANPETALLVRYEELVRAPETTLRDVCRHLGVSYEDRMLRYHEVESEITRHTGNENAFRPVDPTLNDQWKRELNQRQIEVFESLAGEILLRNGYELTAPPRKIPFAVAAAYRLHHAIVSEWQIQFRWRIDPAWRRLTKRLGVKVSRPESRRSRRS